MLSKSKRANGVVFVSLAVIFLSLTACRKQDEVVELSGEAQGTTYHMKIVLKDRTNLESLNQGIQNIFETVDQKISNYRPDSEISRFNQQKTKNWVPVVSEVLELTAVAHRAYEVTGGCFDLTIRPLFDLWGFSRKHNRIPSDTEIKKAKRHIGMDLVEIDRANQKMRKKDPLVAIDLSAVGQGYTVGLIASYLESRGVSNYLVEIGGEMKVRGRKPDGSLWRVAVERPNPKMRQVDQVIELVQDQGMAIMTAGTYRHFFEEGGKTYSHILDPRTGRPVTHQLRSVTILHEDPTWADVWDTALLCVGESDAQRIIEKEGLMALLIWEGGDHDDFQEYFSSALTHSTGIHMGATEAHH